MILPTANGVAMPQPTSQSKAKMDKTQVRAPKALLAISCISYFQAEFLNYSP